MSLTATVTDGSLLLALPVAAVAGLVSFASPCVLPLVPGYLSYVTGLSGSDLAAHRRGRMLAGGALFVLGFSVVFISAGVAFGQLGYELQAHQRLVSQILGVVTIAFGLMFMEVIPAFNRDVRIHLRPAAGLAGAPLIGALFGLGWTPCIGPTLSAVESLAVSQGGAVRGAILSLAYCLGLGVPFVLAALAYRRALGAFGVIKRHYRLIMRLGGGLLVVIGLLLVTGLWAQATQAAQHWAAGFQVVM